MASSVRDTVIKNYAHLRNSDDRLRAAEEENVLFALENLHTYPCVARRLEEGSLHLHGWFFKIDNAELFVYDPKLGQFQPLTRAVPMVQPSSRQG